MTDVVQKTQSQIDAEAYDLFTDWLQDQTNIEKLVSSLLKPAGTVESELQKLRDSFDVDQATGDALDRLGDRVGEARKSRTDAVYRQFIKGRIVANLSKGNAESVYAVARALVDSSNTLKITDYYPAAFHINVANSASDLIYDMFIQIKDAKPAGVRMTGIAEHKSPSSMFTIGDIADYPETDTGRGIGNGTATKGGVLAGSISEDWANRRNKLVLHRRLNDWTERSNSLTTELRDAVYSIKDSQWVAVGGTLSTNATIATSPDGVTWTERTPPKEYLLHGIAYDGSTYCAVGYSDGTDAFIITSPDGITWTERSNPKNVILFDVAYSNGLWVAVGTADGTDAYILTSPDAINWTERSNPKNIALRSVATDGSQWVAVGAADGTDAYVVTSPDGITWTERANARNFNLYGVAFGNGRWVAVGATNLTDAYLISSPDGITWTEYSNPEARDLNAVTYRYGSFVALGNNTGSTYGSYCLTSDDGIAWKQRKIPTTQNVYGVAAGDNEFLGVGSYSGDAFIIQTSGA